MDLLFKYVKDTPKKRRSSEIKMQNYCFKCFKILSIFVYLF